MSKFDDQKSYPYELAGYAILALGVLLGLLIGITVSGLAGILLVIPFLIAAGYLLIAVKRRFEQGKTAFPLGIDGIGRRKRFTVSHSDNTIFVGSKLSGDKITVISEMEIDPENVESLLLHVPVKGQGSITLIEVPTIPEIADMLDQQPPRDRNHRLVSSMMVNFYHYLQANQPGRMQCIAVHGSQKMIKKFRFGPGILIQKLDIPKFLKKIIRYDGRIKEET